MLLTARQVAEHLGIHVKTAQDLIASGEVPAINIATGTKGGKRWRVRDTDLNDWVASRPTNAA